MDYRNEIINEINRIKDHYELANIFKKINMILAKDNISADEYVKEINELYNKYPLEMAVIYKRDAIAKSTGTGKNASSYKEYLVDTLISIAIIKVCNKEHVSFNNDDINHYDFILRVLKSIKK